MVGSCRRDDRWRSSQSPAKAGRRHQVDRTPSHSRPKGLSSPSRQKVVTQSTKGGGRRQVYKSRHTVDRRGCRHLVDKRSSHNRPMGLPSPSQQEGDVVTKSIRGRHTVDRRIGDTTSAQGAGTPSQPKERGHQVNPRGEGDTKSPTEEGGGGTPSRPMKKGRQQVNPRR